MQHPRPDIKIIDTSRGLEGVLIIPTDLGQKLAGWPMPLLFMNFDTSGPSPPGDRILETPQSAWGQP